MKASSVRNLCKHVNTILRIYVYLRLFAFIYEITARKTTVYKYAMFINTFIYVYLRSNQRGTRAPSLDPPKRERGPDVCPPPHPCRPTETVALLCVALFLLPAAAVPASAWDKLMSKVLPRRQFTSAQARHNVGSLFNGARSVARVHLHHRLAELLESDFWVVHAHEAHEVTIHAQDDQHLSSSSSCEHQRAQSTSCVCLVAGSRALR